MRKWSNIEYKLTLESIITNALLTNYVNKFFIEQVDRILDNQHIYVITRVKFISGEIRTIGTLQKINKTSQKDLLEYLIDRLGISKDAYLTTPITSVIFSYGVREGKITPKINVPSIYSLSDSFSQTYYNNKLPLGIYPSDFGNVILQEDNKYIITVSKNVMINLKTTINNLSEGVNLVTYIKNGRVLFSWKDIINGNKLVREIGKSMYFYELFDSGWELTLTRIIKSTKPISAIKVSKSQQNKIITMDFETIINPNRGVHQLGVGAQIPYLLSWTDGIISKSYFIESLLEDKLEENILTMIKKAIDAISIRKYKGYKIYFHNFSKFDAFFLIKSLSKLGDVHPIIYKGKIISVSFTNINYKTSIIFKDSYLLLPSSLKSLSKSFVVETQKSIFPYLFNDINYSGEVPDFKYFSGVTLDEYNQYKSEFVNRIWNFKTEAQKYCELDCKSLHQVLIKFNEMIFNKFSLNINRNLTLPSLSFSLFRSHYLIEDQIKGLSGEVSDHIRSGYTGGAVDMYIPSPPEGRFIWGYDVNSLYPYVMKTFKMPIGTPTYFEGDIRKSDPNSFGFFFCKITSPESLVHPILQTHVKVKEGIRTVSPLGSWEDVIFSPEMDNAIKFGYKFEILWGYTFNRGIIFKEFVNYFYKLRLDYPKTDPMNYVAKIILNSLYGRFGMSDEFI